MRRALSEAIDRHRVVQVAGGTLSARTTCQIVPPGYAGYRPYCPYTVDANRAGAWIGPNLAAARALVHQSHTEGAKITVWVQDTRPLDPLLPPLARYVATALRSLGYQASVTSVKGKTWEPYIARVAAPETKAQIGIANWIPDFADNNAIFPVQLTCGLPRRLNLSDFCDPAADRLIRRAGELEATDQAAASRLWSTVDRRIINQAPWIPLVDWQASELVSHRLGHYTYNPQLGFLIDQAWVR